jgi:hypothetical protein
MLQANFDTLAAQVGVLKSTPYMPTRPLQNPLSARPDFLATQVRQLVAAVKPVGSTTQVGANSVPRHVVTCSAKANATTGMVTVPFIRNGSDKNFASVRVWLAGYQKNSQPQLLASGVQSPVTFPYTSTGEHAVVIVQTVSPTGAVSDLAKCARSTVKLV